MRECLRALIIAFSATTVPSPLPDHLCTTIETLLERYNDIDQFDSQRFHEDLHALYLRHVADVPEKHGAFLSVLRLLQPVMTAEARLTAWWDLILKPTIDGMGHTRQEREDAREFLQNVLVYDVDVYRDSERARLSSLFTNKILDLYLARTAINSSAEHKISVENSFISHELEAILVAFGRKMPKPFLLKVDQLFVQKRFRLQALNLLSAYVRLQPPHLHLVLETPLIYHLEKCLLIDTVSLVVEVALAVLIMFLPHIFGALTTDHHLEKIFLVYIRILCWDKLGNGAASGPANQGSQLEYSQEKNDAVKEHQSEAAWEQVQEPLGYSNAIPPSMKYYYTFLYGLFPLNFMSFIRKPRKYLKSLNFPGAHEFDLDEELIHRRTEPIRKAHLLHTNMFTMTVEDELNQNQWLKSDPADVVTCCMDLYIATPTALHELGAPSDTNSTHLYDVLHDSLLTEEDNSTPNNTHNQPDTTKMVSSNKFDELSVASEFSISNGDVGTDTLTRSLVKDENGQNSSITSPSLNSQSFVHLLTAEQSLKPTDLPDQSITVLQREIMLLRNDLAFERYLKSQHLAHIGRLQRKHVKEVTADAETQNLIHANKILKTRLAKADELYAQLKKETLTSRNQSKKWESDLSAKVRSFRESEQNWQNDRSNLLFKLQQVQSDYEHLRKIVEKAEFEQLNAQHKMRALEYDLEEYQKVRRELMAAQDQISVADNQKRELKKVVQERDELRNDLKIAHTRLLSKDKEHKHFNDAYEHHVTTLEKRLQVAESSGRASGQLSPATQQVLDSTLAASNAKLGMLENAHRRLLEQFKDLQMKFYELEGEQKAESENKSSQAGSNRVDLPRTQKSHSSGLQQIPKYDSRRPPPSSHGMLYSDESRHDSDHDYSDSAGASRTFTPSSQSARGKHDQ